MSNLRNLLIGAIIYIAIATVSELIWITPAIALTQNIQWQGSAGYTVTGRFSYDDADLTTITEHGAGKTEQLQSLSISVYDPDGNLLHTYNNVVDGVARGNYFEFNFDTKTQQLLNSIDLGGESPGELYLKGKPDRELSLIEVEPSGKERVIDRNSGHISLLK